MHDRERPPAPPKHAAGAAVAGWALVGALPLALGWTDPGACWSWPALLTLPAGWQLGARRATHAWLVPLAWALAARLALGSDAGAVDVAAAAAALAGLLAAAWGLAAGFACAAWPGAGVALLASALASAAALRGTWAGESWSEAGSPRLAAALLDAAPPSLVAEVAGVDWMRHPAVYEPAGSEWFSDRRAPYRAELAAPTVLLVGCALAALGRRRSGVVARRDPALPPRAT